MEAAGGVAVGDLEGQVAGEGVEEVAAGAFGLRGVAFEGLEEAGGVPVDAQLAFEGGAVGVADVEEQAGGLGWCVRAAGEEGLGLGDRGVGFGRDFDADFGDARDSVGVLEGLGDPVDALAVLGAGGAVEDDLDDRAVLEGVLAGRVEDEGHLAVAAADPLAHVHGLAIGEGALEAEGGGGAFDGFVGAGFEDSEAGSEAALGGPLDVRLVRDDDAGGLDGPAGIEGEHAQVSGG